MFTLSFECFIVTVKILINCPRDLTIEIIELFEQIAFEKVFQFKEKDTNLELNNLSLKRKQIEDITNRNFRGTEAIVREVKILLKNILNRRFLFFLTK